MNQTKHQMSPQPLNTYRLQTLGLIWGKMSQKQKTRLVLTSQVDISVLSMCYFESKCKFTCQVLLNE